MITKQIIFIQIAALILCYFTIAFNQNKFNVKKWNHHDQDVAVLTFVLIQFIIIIYDCFL
jgi:hypothetical protein